MNVLSLFDGISCGQLAAHRAGLEVGNYYASEIDEYAMAITEKNYPATVFIGDVYKVKPSELPPLDLLLGGSPCQSFSVAGKKEGFLSENGRLFFEYVRILRESKPRWFLYENVICSSAVQAVISKALGVKPLMLDASFVSAQNRKRLYWTNIPTEELGDLGITLGDVLIDGCGVELDLEGTLENYSFKKNYVQWDKSGKGYNSQDQRAFYSDNKHGTVPKSRTITKCKVFYKDVNKKSYKLKCLGLNEIEVLQTLPYNYTLLQDGFSLNKSTEAIGNGWCVNVIAHILKGIKKKTIGFGG